MTLAEVIYSTNWALSLEKHLTVMAGIDENWLVVVCELVVLVTIVHVCCISGILAAFKLRGELCTYISLFFPCFLYQWTKIAVLQFDGIWGVALYKAIRGGMKICQGSCTLQYKWFSRIKAITNSSLAVRCLNWIRRKKMMSNHWFYNFPGITVAVIFTYSIVYRSTHRAGCLSEKLKKYPCLTIGVLSHYIRPHVPTYRFYWLKKLKGLSSL